MNRGSAIAIVIALVVLAGASALLVSNAGNSSAGRTAETSDNQQSRPAHENTTQATEPTGGDAVTTDEVEIEDFAYRPAVIRVKAGTTVTWTNKDAAQHNVVDDDNPADGPNGPLLNKGESYSFTFEKPGTYTYHCSPHPQMTGTVIVE